jgi:aminopeptidase N
MPRTRRFAILVCCGTVAATPVHAQPRDQLAPGVSVALARHRAATLSDIRYRIAAALPADRAAPIRTRVTTTVVRRDSGPLIIDFDATPAQLLGVTANGTPLGPLAPQNGHVVIPARALRTGTNTIVIDCLAGNDPLNRNDDFLYTVFVPARARQAFPLFDQPDLKARFTLELSLPGDWQAVANGAEQSRTSEQDAEGTGRAVVRFAETKPLPTYLFAFAAGRFVVDSAMRNGRWFRIFHRERDTIKVARNRDPIVDLHAQSLDWMERYTGIPYAWGKFDVFLAPAFQFGGMEHAGAIFYNASSLMLDATATQAQLLGRASVIAHETAHLWFGDLVTMQWFNDVWLKEVFANFFAAKIVNPAFPQINHPLRFLFSHYPSAYDVDRTAGTHPIRQPLDNLADAGSLYGAIIYQKAPIMMRQLELLLGESAFRGGMRSYLTRYAYRNATWPDLVRILDARTPVDLASWSRSWVDEAGRPEITVQTEPQPSPTVRIVQRDTGARGRRWPQQIEIAIGDAAGRTTLLPQRLSDRTAAIPLDATRSRFLLPTGSGLAYGDVILDDASRRALLTDLPFIVDPLQRGSALVTLLEEMQQRRLPADSMRGALMALLAVEQDELIVQRALGYWDALWSRWLEPSSRAMRAATHEAALQRRLAGASTPGGRLSWFRALVRTAESDSTVAWLHRVWQGTDSVAGLALGEDDVTALALQLAVRAVTDWRAVLDTQATRITNADRRARFAFVRRAASADSAERRQFFDSLRDAGNRRREPWVLDGLSLLHHPLRAESAEQYVGPALLQLEEIKRTGDIFFPKRWIDVTLSGHRSPAVAGVVRAYLRAHPALDPRLRSIVLQSADELWRVADRTPSARGTP